MQRITVIGGGFAGLTAAISAAEAGAKVTLYEAHDSLGGRARTAEGPYLTNEGPHAFYSEGPHWAWLKQRDLIGPLAPVPAFEASRGRFRHRGVLRRNPPVALLKLIRHSPEQAPLDRDFHSWAAGLVGEDTARTAAHFAAATLYHHDPGSLSAAFVHARLRRWVRLPSDARYPLGGWGSVIDRMAGRAWNLGVRMETMARIETLPSKGPVIVATSLTSARALLGDPSLVWHSGRTALLDVAVRSRRGDVDVVTDLDSGGAVERFTVRDRSLAPEGEQLIQGHTPIAPWESAADGAARAEGLLDLGFPGWRERTTLRRQGISDGRTGAVDPPGTTWRDRPGIDRGDGVYLAGDQVAAPGMLSEVSFNSAVEAVARVLTEGRFGPVPERWSA
ncbi:NAD(P)-binding protein [Streptomyces sp. NPDC050560]|uniref:NAD(P)-binding protein n=1 Tax=Streptomyces sp. NPDC050560 TaxID=3365630 RepID=UPI003794FD88